MFGWMSNHRILLACGRKPSCGTVRIEFRLCFAHLWMSDECCESMLCDRLPSKLDKVLSHLWTLQRRKANRKHIQYLTLQQGRKRICQRVCNKSWQIICTIHRWIFRKPQPAYCTKEKTSSDPPNDTMQLTGEAQSQGLGGLGVLTKYHENH